MYGRFSKLFDTQAALYSRFRPTYPQELFDIIDEYGDFGAHGVALDLATGTGQAACHLARSFEKVLAMDCNDEQLSCAVTCPNVTYHRGFAEDTGLPDNSVDLVTVSQALHWFELDAAFREIHRVLSPKGVLAAWCYGVPTVDGNAAASHCIWDVRFASDKLGPYWSPENKLVDQQYRSIQLNPGLFTDVQHVQLSGSQETTINGLIGFLESWSAYAKLKAAQPDTDLLDRFRRSFLEACGHGNDEHGIGISWPIYLLLARNCA